MVDNETNKEFCTARAIMEIELPSGCNVINSATSFYNYTNNNRTRALYYIYEGQIIKSNEQTNVNPYTYTGECLQTGDLIYKPEYKEFVFPNIAIIMFFVIVIIVFRLLRGRG